MNRGALAYGHARVRAMRSHLLGPADALVLYGAQGMRAMVAAFTGLGLDPADSVAVARVAYERLGLRLAALARIYPPHAEVFEALVGLYEAWNLGLAWAALAHARDADRSREAFRALGPLATFAPDDVAEAPSPTELAARLARTPWGEVSERVRRAHPGDVPAARLAFDRFACERVVAAARGLPKAEALARDLLLDRVRDRDLDLLARSAAFGLSPEAAAGATALLSETAPAGRLRALAEWTPDAGPLEARLPRGLAASPIPGWEALRLERARARRAGCRRAFLAGGIGLAPAVALALLADAEARALVGLAEAAGAELAKAVLARVLAEGAMGG